MWRTYERREVRGGPAHGKAERVVKERVGVLVLRTLRRHAAGEGTHDEIFELALVIVHNAEYGTIRPVIEIMPLLADAEMGLHCLAELDRLHFACHKTKEEAEVYCIDVDGIFPLDDWLKILGTKLPRASP